MDGSDPMVGQGFSLVMQLEDPTRLPQLMLALRDEWDTLRGALAELDYVHYARFLPLWDHGLLLIVTEFDGDMRDYVTDFAAVVGPQFDMILSYMKDRPPRPVAVHTAAFWDYVQRNTRPRSLKAPPYDQPFTAYHDKSVFEIIGGARRKRRFEPPALALRMSPPPAVGDVQANVLRGYRARHVCHVMLRFAGSPDPPQRAASARAFVRSLLTGERGPTVDFHGDFRQRDAHRPSCCVNIGFTYDGLSALGVPEAIRQAFPPAFREGPEVRAARVGDGGAAAPVHWTVPPRKAGAGSARVDLMISLWAADDGALGDALWALAALCAEHGLDEVHSACGQALDDRSTVHFGYVDRAGQPRIPGITPDDEAPTGDPSASLLGDFVLGRDRVNSRGGCFIGGLPDGLATDATYAALRVIAQDVAAFERMLDTVADTFSLEDRVKRPPADAAAQARARHERRETVAAKLMGRWRDGTPLAVAPDGPPATPVVTNAFDYVVPDAPASQGSAGAHPSYIRPPQVHDDLDGRICPIGAHVRRLNPRGGSVVGVPLGRRVIRRGLPFGPAWDPDDPDDDQPRGLLGLFLCGDLESQYEFLLAAWAKGDLAAPGLRDTHDPFGGFGRATPFRMRLARHLREVEIAVPPLTRTIGSLYLFMPGRGGLAWLAEGRWSPASAVPAPSRRGADGRATGPAQPAAAARFNPASVPFRNDPDAAYAADRAEGIVEVAGVYRGYWVLGADLVGKVLADPQRFPKPAGSSDAPDPIVGATRSQRNGLFYLNGADHLRVRRAVDPLMQQMLARVAASAAQEAGKLLPALNGRTDFVEAFARPLPRDLFMRFFDVPCDASATAQKAAGGDRAAAALLRAESLTVDQWARAMLDGNDRTAAPLRRGGGATASLAMRAYFAAQIAQRQASPGTTPGLLDGLAAKTCPHYQSPEPQQLHADEAMNTAVHFALGGYLSTEFLLVNGMELLLRHGQWDRLRRHRNDARAVAAAVHEMLRFAPPFQLADRWVAPDPQAPDTPVAFDRFALQPERRLTLVYAAANRDGPGLDEFDIDRFLGDKDPVTHHYGFGGPTDPHYCIGAQMAVTVATAAFTALLEAFPAPRLDAVGPGLGDPYFRSRRSLHVVF